MGHWPLFWAALVLAFLIDTAVSTNWAYAIGHVGIAALIGFFLIRRAVLPVGYILGYGVLVALEWQSVSGALESAETGLRTACIQVGSEVALIEREQDKLNFCGCYAEKMSRLVVQAAAISYFTLGASGSVRDDPAMVKATTEASTECAAKL